MRIFTDTQIGILFFSKPKKCYVFNLMIHIFCNSRILMHSSSLREPRDPLSKVVFKLFKKFFFDK